MMNDGSAEQRIRLFRNDTLERLTLISPVSFALTWAAMLALAVYASWGVATIAASAGLVAAGLLIWSLFEYAMHRFFFHLKPASKFGQTLIFLAHGNHHAQPDDPMRNIMPPMVSIVVAGVMWGVFFLLAGQQGSVIFLGWGIGYVLYDSVHYACHQMPMRHGMLGRLRRHHIRHHYAKTEGNYAITAIFWDRLFGTEVPAKRH